MQPYPKNIVAVDDWDRHWNDFAETPDYSPAVYYRRRVLVRMLGICAEEAGRRLVELGSGSGQFAREFCPRFPKVRFLGLDISRAGVEQARLHTPSAQFEMCDLLNPIENRSIRSFEATDAICSEVLEHVDEPQRILTNTAAVMAPGCRLVVTVPGGPMNAFDRHIGHRRHYTPEELGGLLTSAGYQVERALGIGFPFYNLYRLALFSAGSSVVKIASGPPSLGLRAAYHLFNAT